MKKIALLILATGVLVPCSLSAQKKSKKKESKVAEKTAEPVSIQSQNDSISYAFGASLTQGLPQYLTQLEVLTDTAAISREFNLKIENESDPKKQESLRKELVSKLDSTNTANSANTARFLDGISKGLNDSKDKAYETGLSIAGQLKEIAQRFASETLKEGEAVNLDKFKAGFLAAFKGENMLINEPSQLIDNLITKSREDKAKAEEAALKEQYAETIAEGEKFMAENEAKPGVISLPSGLQYKVLKKGEGAIPQNGEKVTVHYHGTLLDGTVFDSSVDRGEPISFNVGQLIKGWNEALMLMPEGSKWVLYIPYDLAYGTRDQGPIKPFSNLIFEVELIKVGNGE